MSAESWTRAQKELELEREHAAEVRLLKAAPAMLKFVRYYLSPGSLDYKCTVLARAALNEAGEQP